MTPDEKAALQGHSPWNDGRNYEPDFWQPTPTLWRRYAATIGGWIICLCIIAFLCGVWWLVLTVKANAHSADHPDMNDWLMAQTNSSGWVCCDGDDVVQLSDNEWRIKDGHYEAFYQGTWWKITDQMLSPGGNKLPSAILWWYANAPRCFKPANLY